jgi:hypothetical protein
MTNEKKEELKKRILEIQKELADLSDDDLNQVVGGVQGSAQEGDPGIFVTQPIVVQTVQPAVAPFATPVVAPTVMPNVNTNTVTGNDLVTINATIITSEQ